MPKDVYISQGYSEAPPGSQTSSMVSNFQQLGNNYKSTILFQPRRLWVSRCHREQEFFMPLNTASAFKFDRHVPRSNLSLLSSRRYGKPTRRCRQDLLKRLYSLIYNPNIILISSSSQPSPQSSVASFVFSPSGSSSSRSPPSSQDSYTDLSPYPAHLVRRQPRIQVSSLLADPFTRTYHLEVIQQPQKTAEFGHSSLSRLPLTPPIIARLTVRDSSGNSVIPEAELPFLIAHLSLFSGDGLTALDMGSRIGRGQSPPILYGNLVSSIDQLEDLQGNMGLFFVFPDVSIRWRGQFQLGINVMRLSRSDPSGGMSIADHGIVLAGARTRTFDVLPHNQYTAVPRTRLTNSFLRQGARMFTFMSHNA